MEKYNPPLTMAIKHKDINIRMSSRSGGVFTACSDYILNHKGVVYGCVLTNDLNAVHFRATSKSDRDKMRGSKYIESKLGDTFKYVRKDLLEGKLVLFSGTSCQVAGLQKYLDNEYDNLICIDILCYGVPSVKVWHQYVKWQEKKNGKCIGADFRNKKDYGWAEAVETLIFQRKNKIHKKDSRIFTNIFYSNMILRPSCYECRYKNIWYPGDITIGDYWEIDRVYPEINDNKGVSLVMINNNKGMQLINAIKESVEWYVTPYEKSIRNSMLFAAKRPDNREEFWKEFKFKSFNFIASKYANYGYKQKLKEKVKSFLRISKV